MGNPTLLWFLNLLLRYLTSLNSGNFCFFCFTAFAPPTPPPNTGYHRYEFLLLLQGEKLVVPPTTKRARFDRKSFEDDYNLILIAQSAFKARRIYS